jgi:hypothetical protein
MKNVTRKESRLRLAKTLEIDQEFLEEFMKLNAEYSQLKGQFLCVKRRHELIEKLVNHPNHVTSILSDEVEEMNEELKKIMSDGRSWRAKKKRFSKGELP